MTTEAGTAFKKDLPLGWAIVSLADVLPDPRPKIRPSPDTDLPFIGMDSIPPGSTSVGKLYRFSEMRSAAGHFSPGDVLYGRMRPYLNKVHRADFEGACSAEFIVIPESTYLDSDFLKYLLHNRDFVSFASSKSSGDRPRVDIADIGGYFFGLPPLNEQRRIVEKIDELFSQIEAGEQALERAQRFLERHRQSVLNAAVTGELTRDWREQHKGEIESGEALLDRILQARCEAWEQADLAKMHARGKRPTDGRWKQKYKEPEPPDLSDTPEIPVGWHLVSCDALAYHLTSGSRAWKPFYGKGNSTFIMAQNVRPGRYDPGFRQLVDPPLDDPETDRTRAQQGDLLVTIVGANTGDVCRFDLNVHDHYVCQSVALIRPWSETYVQYLALYLQADDGGQRQYRRYIYGAGRPHLSFAQLRQTVIALPPEREAAEIIVRAEEILSELDAVASDVMRLPKFITALRQSVLRAAFSGKLVPQNPADEPASVLLERIREEGAAAVQDASPKRPGHPGRPSKKGRPAMVKTRKEIKPTHLRDILRASNGGMVAEALWKASELDIDDFYKQLRGEVAAGHLHEERHGETPRLVCR